MTIGIAAISNYEKEILLVNDSKVSFGTTSADRAVSKNEPLIGTYAVLIAGNDVARAPIVIERTRARFVGATKMPSASEVSEALFEECTRERDRVAEATVLRKHGFDWQHFRTNGKNTCTDAVYYDLHAELANVELSLDFIVAGFDEKKAPHIRFTNWRTPPEDYTTLGFYAIGSGAQAAIASLAHAVEHLGFTRWDDTGDVLYHVLTAKFMAEAAQDVGEDTWAMAISADGHRHLSPYGAAEFIREQWKRKGAPRVPKGIGAVIEELLYKHTGDLMSVPTLERMAKYLPRAKQFLKILKRRKEAAATSSTG